jgi:hypothetical protein
MVLLPLSVRSCLVLREALGNRCCFGDVMQCVRWVLPVESEHVTEYVSFE